MEAGHDLAAAIDLGTNTALLLVARRGRTGDLVVVEDHCRTPRLGSGLAGRSTLDPDAIERTLDALRFFAQRLRALPVREARTRAVSTAVLRRAGDAPAFVERVRRELGLEIEVIPAEEEARLGNVAAQAEGVGPETIVIDVGGGSTEVTCPTLGLRRSIPMGAVVLSETFLGDRPLWPGGFPALFAVVHEASRAFPADIAADGRPVIALGGTALNLGAIARGLPVFDPEQAEGAEVEAASVGELPERLAALPTEARSAFTIERDRAAILPAGLACLAVVLERLDAKRLRVSGRGLRFGIVRELLDRP